MLSSCESALGNLAYIVSKELTPTASDSETLSFLFDRYRSFAANSDKIQHQGRSSWLSGIIYLSHTVGALNIPISPSDQIFKQLYWKDLHSTHSGETGIDGSTTYNFYLRSDDTEEEPPLVEYAGAVDVARSVLDGTVAFVVPPLPPHEVIWGGEMEE